MPTLDELRDLDGTPLDDLEREQVRQLLNITGKAGTATFIESETRMSLLTESQNRIVRGLLLDYDDIGFDTLFVQGGTKGADYNPQRDKAAIANELRRMLYPGASNEVPDVSSYIPSGSIQFVPVEYVIGSQDEFN